MAGVDRQNLMSRSSSAASSIGGDEERFSRYSEWEDEGSGAGHTAQEAQHQLQHHYPYQQPGKGQTQGLLSREVRLEGRRGSRGLWPPFMLLFASALLIASEVYIKSARHSPPSTPQGSPGLLQASAIAEPSRSLSTDSIAAEQGEWVPRDKSLAEAVAALTQRASSLQAANTQLEKALMEMRREMRRRAAEEVRALVQLDHLLTDVQQEAAQQYHDSPSVSTSGLHLTGMLEQLQNRVRSQLAQQRQVAIQEEVEEKEEGSGEKQEEGEDEEYGAGKAGLTNGLDASSLGQAGVQDSALLQQEQDPETDTDTAPDIGSGSDAVTGMGIGRRVGTGVRSSTVARKQLLASWEAWLREERDKVEALEFSPGEDDFPSSTGWARHSGTGPLGVRSLGSSLSPVPLHPPLFEDCMATAKMVKLWDERKADGSMPYWSPLGARTELASRQALLRAAEALAAKAEAAKKRKGKLWKSVQEALDLLADAESQWQAVENQAEMTHRRAGRVRPRQALEIQAGMAHGDQVSHRSAAQWHALDSARHGLPESANGIGGAQGGSGAKQAEAQGQALESWQKSRFERPERADGAQQGEGVQGHASEGLPGVPDGFRAGAVFPPWVHGADEDLLVLTRAVQHDLWQLQHPRNCTLPSTKFLVVNASQLFLNHYMGVGAQLAWLTGALAEAVNQGRVMVISFYERADHDGCKGYQRARWACYFAPETTEQCRTEALRLAQDPAAVRARQVTFSSNKTPRPTRFFFYDVPGLWGRPWKLLHRTVEVGGVLTGRTHTDSRRWWFAQATRYLMRYPSPRLCSLLNGARHHAFGSHVADMVVAHGPAGKQGGGMGGSGEDPTTEAEQGMPVRGIPLQLRPGVGLAGVWAATRRPYVPHGLISVHVRQGDKDREMRLYGFSAYMSLASRIRAQFPHASSVWLSTEMASVVREAETEYPRWTFHFTDFPRQTEKNMSMREYERQLGMQSTSDNAFVNLFMAAEADFFVGALGSTWSILIDNLRVTSGKVPSGFVSVNGDRYWFAKRTAGDDQVERRRTEQARAGH